MEVYIIPALRILLGGLFAISALLKLPSLKDFAVIVAKYDILPRQLVKPVAYAQPFVELFIGLWLLSGQMLFFGSIAGILLMIAANIFTFSAYFRRKKIDNCGCYGTSIQSPLTWKKLVENIIITLLLFVLAFIS